jgi:hypothetical protein
MRRLTQLPAGLGIGAPQVLGHKRVQTTDVYAHLADDPLRTVADRTAARIAAAMERRTRPDYELISLRPHRAYREAEILGWAQARTTGPRHSTSDPGTAEPSGPDAV